MDTKKEETQVITLRIEKNLIEKIDNDAKQERRSRTAQIIYMIEKYYDIKEIANK